MEYEQEKPITTKKYMKVVDLRHDYQKCLPPIIVQDIENQVLSLSAKFRLSMTTAQKIVELVANETIKKNNNTNGISRAKDSKNKKYWLARIYGPNRKNKNPAFSKCFYDSSYGGKEQSFEAAVNWRNLKESEIDSPKTNFKHYISSKNLSTKRRRQKVDELLKIYGKSFILVGKGPFAAEKAKQMGQAGRTFNNIYNKRANGFHLGYSKPRYEVNGFINEITPEIEKEIRKNINNKKERWMSSEEIEDAVSSCLLSYASINLEETDKSSYIPRLTSFVIRTARCRKYSRNAETLVLDQNGDVLKTNY